jgi:4-hydroxy-3-polyprenylbenzoate decarboxylase
VRWQFIGGMPEDQRRAFCSPTYRLQRAANTTCRWWSARSLVAWHLRARHGPPVEEIGEAWMAAIAHPIPPVATNEAPCQEVVITGAALKTEGLKALPVPVSTPGFDAAPYLTATLCVTKDPDSGVRNMGTYRVALKAADRAVVRMVAREATGAGGFLHWLKYRERKEKMPIADRGRRCPYRDVHRPAEACDRRRRDGGRGRSGRRGDPHDALPHHRPRRAGGCRDRGRGPDRL